MKKTFYTVLGISAVLTVLFAALLLWRGGEVWVTLTTTAATTLYHFLMRLLIGFAVEKADPTWVSCNGFWFRERPWEKKLYRFLRVRKWAKRVPTFDPAQFDVTAHTPEQLARQMCLSETVHVLIVVFGYASLLFCLFFDDPMGNLLPFLITAFFAGLYDLQFVVLQRFNRPKVLRLIERKRKREEVLT